MEKISFLQADGVSVEFYVLEQTRISGVNYILVTESEDENGDALVLKDLSSPEDTESLYEIVEGDRELHAVAEMFENMLSNIELL